MGDAKFFSQVIAYGSQSIQLQLGRLTDLVSHPDEVVAIDSGGSGRNCARRPLGSVELVD